MTTRIELPGGHWAEIKDPMDITERELSPLKEAFLEMETARRGPTPGVGEVAVTGALHPMAGGLGQAAPPSAASSQTAREQIQALEAFEHTAYSFFIEAWDFPFPVTPDALYDIPVPCKNALDKATAPLLEEMFPGLKEKDDGRPTTP